LDLQVEDNLATRGLLVRHLALPDGLSGSVEIINFLADGISSATAINVMDQYHPCFEASSHPRINQRVHRAEYLSIRKYAAEKGLKIID